MLGFKRLGRGLPMSSSTDRDQVAIRVQNLSKCYQIYDSPRDRLKQFVFQRFRKDNKQYFREFWALKDVSFEVKKGETVGIIGRNGCGKSTLLQMICGTLNPTSGEVQTNGRIAALLELGSGFNPEFTGRENVYLNAAVLGLDSDSIDQKFDLITAFADIGDFIDQPVKTYSSGMMVRLAFAVIAHVDADILVIDEALAVGDAFFTQKCMRFLRAFMDKGTVLFVSHDTAAVTNLCQKVVWLYKGVVNGVGDAKKMTENYLQKMYEDQQGTSVDPRKISAPKENSEGQGFPRDMRADFINKTQLRNDIELFSFSKDSPSFGTGVMSIYDVRICDEFDQTLAWVVGGERVKICIKLVANEAVFSPIVGFLVKDRLGQVVFADNTYVTYMNDPVFVAVGENINANFEFTMPVMPVGDYTISVAVAEGSQLNHVQHQWIHDALAFKVHSSMVCHGLIGVPMVRIELTK